MTGLTRVRVALLACCALSATPVAAQEGDETAPPSALTTAETAQLRAVLDESAAHDWFLRVSSGRAVVSGRVGDVGVESVRVAGARMPVALIDRIERRDRTVGGALVGSVVGGLVMAAVMANSLESACRAGCLPALAGTGFTLGVVVGGLGGMLLAPPVTTWQTLWTEPVRP